MAYMEYEDSYTDLEVESAVSMLSMLEESDFGDTSPELMELPDHLITKDYTMDSPLLRDDLDNYLARARGQMYNPFFDQKRWSRRDESLYLGGVRAERLSGCETFHNWLGNYFLSLEEDSKDFEKLVKQVDSDAAQSFPIVHAFILKWLKKLVSFKSRVYMRQETLAYGVKFYEWHKIVLMLNSSTLDEAGHLCNTFGAVLTIGDRLERVFTYESVSLGTVVITEDCVVLKKLERILDRNMALLVKDACGARFQTLMHVQYKEVPMYGEDHYQQVLDVFSSGDRLISELGSSAYDIIKMIEALCLDRMSQLANETRPLFNRFLNFSRHLDRTRSEMISRSYWVEPYFDSIKKLSNLEELLTCYGSFRLWGHPFIDYFEGLKQLHHNTTMPKEIDKKYANKLASNLAYKVLKSKFDKDKIWYVDLNILPQDHILYPIIQSNSWPSASVISLVGDNWHHLPLMKCFDFPEVIDPSIIYSDRSYSPNKSELIDHLSNTPQDVFKSKSVLESLLSKSATDWKEFLRRVNDEGLSEDSLIIGLSAKERELKIIGRFFALMSWELREYFVITEYLIKLFFVPLFNGITMADDFNVLTSKLLAASEGQGGEGYTEITVANHVDYSKWNNHQRGDANNPVFRVMGQFLGYPNLIERTHEFFEKSLIYYRSRTDLMSVEEGKVINKTDQLVCWNGQPGGLEGLRQKGWSIVNYLCIEDQSDVRKTCIRVLAQGDNQVITMHYKVRPWRSESELGLHLREVKDNNEFIMKRIRGGTKKLGLVINEDETLQSEGMLVYGKVVVFRGAIQGLHEKRLSRILCTTNDQLPNLSSIMGSVGTNCLTVCHFSDSPINSIIQYNWLGNFARNLLEIHNPAIKAPVATYLKKNMEHEKFRYKVNCLYLDPSLGGIGGMSLNRFLIRQFPDPITESLTFWKQIYESGVPMAILDIALRAGHPKIGKYKSDDFGKLIENPTGINLPRGLSAQNVLRDQVRAGLLKDPNAVTNKIIRAALERINESAKALEEFLESIEPCFPRFISEFYSASFMGIVDGIVSLFENSRTIRNRLKNQIGPSFDLIVINAERCCIESLTGMYQVCDNVEMWKCSSTHADHLRKVSWNREIIGATVPHPFELLQSSPILTHDCDWCSLGGRQKDYVCVTIPKAPGYPTISRGPYCPYLGSRTSESTSLITPWEKDSKVPFIRLALVIRTALFWFVNSDSNLGRAILDNIRKLTGEEPGGAMQGYKRTGSALHRFKCSRQSNGGFIGCSPNLSTYFVVTTDPLKQIGQINHDFMHQSLLVYAQITAASYQMFDPQPGTHHFHINCLECLREITEPTLEAPHPFVFPDMSEELMLWKPSTVPWFIEKNIMTIQPGDWDVLSTSDKSYHLGRLLGFCHAEFSLGSSSEVDNLFPNVIGKGVRAVSFLSGIVDGLYRSSCLAMVHRHSVTYGKYYRSTLKGNYSEKATRLSKDSNFLNLVKSSSIYKHMALMPHKISASYPASDRDIGETVYSYLDRVFSLNYLYSFGYEDWMLEIWLFSEFMSTKIAGPYLLAARLTGVFLGESLTPANKQLIREVSNLEGQIKTGSVSDETLNYIGHGLTVKAAQMEFRAAAKIGLTEEDIPYEDSEIEFGESYVGRVFQYEVPFSLTISSSYVKVPDVRDPTISGLRLAQLATGSHYKFSSMIKSLNIRYRDFICGGDGSGGGTACLLRLSITSRGVYNSLMAGEGIKFHGTTPTAPLALAQMPKWVQHNCVNLENCWENPSDLQDSSTWLYFKRLVKAHRLTIDLILLDMELTTSKCELGILSQIRTHGLDILTDTGTVIFKSYIGALMNNTVNCLNLLAPMFEKTQLVQTEISGSFTSEVYVIMSYPRKSKTGARYVDFERLSTIIPTMFCFKTIEQEFVRALSLFNTRTLEGIPEIYIPDQMSELSQIFIWMGVDKSLVNLIAECIVGSATLYKCEDTLAGLIYACSTILPVNRAGDKNSAYPSDQTVTKVVSTVLGTMTWISLCTRNLALYRAVHNINQRSVTFHYSVRDKKGYITVDWSLKYIRDIQKIIRLDDKQSSQARVIRLLTRLSCFYRPNLVKERILNRLKVFPHVSNVKAIIHASGIMEFFDTAPIELSDQRAMGYNDEVDLQNEFEL